MPISLNALPSRAGIFIYEQTAGATPPEITLYRRTYLVASSAQGTRVPTPISNLDDFENTFGSSSALIRNAITAYLRNTRIGLFFVRAIAYPIATLLIDTKVTAPASYSVTINNHAVSVTVPAPVTSQSVLDRLLVAINDDTAINSVVEAELPLDSKGVPVYTTGELIIRSLNGEIFTLSSSAHIAVSPVKAPDELKLWDYDRTLNEITEDQGEEPLGFICVPEAFYQLSSQHDRTAVGNLMEGAARQLGWMALIDPGHPSLINTPSKARDDAERYVASHGHSAYYFPYCIDVDNDHIPPSVLVAAFAIQRYESEGIHKPPAGTSYPFEGVAGLSYSLKNARINKKSGDLDFLADNRINPILYKRGVGYIPFDTYTRAFDTNFRHISTRVILSCIERSIYETLDRSGLLFDAVGSRGVFYLKIKNVIEGVLDRFWDGDALYGLRPEDAYRVICDASLQTSADLEAGIVRAAIYCSPSATCRQAPITLYRVPIGKMNQALSTVIG